MRRTAAVSIIAACGLLASCGSRSPVAKGAQNTTGLPTVNKPEASPSGAPPRNSAVKQPVTEPAKRVAIPAALQGRWGLTPMDCTSKGGDAKGLLIVEPNVLRFYESRAMPAADVQTGPNSMAGTFDFTGEGQSWSKYQALELRDHKLIRTESNPTASFSYAKCD
jgi:hypothetical protein